MGTGPFVTNRTPDTGCYKIQPNGVYSGKCRNTHEFIKPPIQHEYKRSKGVLF